MRLVGGLAFGLLLAALLCVVGGPKASAASSGTVTVTVQIRRPANIKADTGRQTPAGAVILITAGALMYQLSAAARLQFIMFTENRLPIRIKISRAGYA